jgi:hypothetical protein
MSLVDAQVLAELRRVADDATAARRGLQDHARDVAIDSAIAAGKTTPAQRDHWVKLWDADSEGTRALLDSLATGVVPTSELGTSADLEQAADLDVNGESLARYAAQIGVPVEALLHG